MVRSDQDLEQVLGGEGGLLTDPAPRAGDRRGLLDGLDRVVGGMREACAATGASSSSPRRSAATARSSGPAGSPWACSGPEETFDRVQQLLDHIGKHATYVGEGDVARLVKICHNLMLGVVTQSMAEITVLAEKGGVPRAAFLEFLNNSVMGSVFTRYKTPAFVHLDYTPTFTPILLRKDFDLGLAAAPRPRRADAGRRRDRRSWCRPRVSSGRVDEDFAILLDQQAPHPASTLKPEDTPVDDGLAPDRRTEMGRDAPLGAAAGTGAHGGRLRGAGRLRPAAATTASGGPRRPWRAASAVRSCSSTSTTSATRRRPGSAVRSATR